VIAASDRFERDTLAMEEALGLNDARANMDHLEAEHEVLLHPILATPARTVDGLRVKAQLVAWHLGQGMPDEEDDHALGDRHFARSMIADIEAMAAASAATVSQGRAAA
jgi:hypothetical protein